MRTSGQYCSVAKALDLVGDRWSLLIVRELLLRDACRYTDLKNGLPGIATHLLADRLRELERVGVIEREEAPPPVAATLFRLTDRGRDLHDAVYALGRWGMPLMPVTPDDDAYRSYWLALPLETELGDRKVKGPPVTIEVHSGEEPVVVETVDGTVRTRSGTAEKPDAVVTGTPRLVVGALSGRIDLDEARASGLEYEGDPKAIRRLSGAGR